MADLSIGEVPSYVGVYYDTASTLDQIQAGEREFCLELLQNMGFRCLAGAVGIGDQTDHTIGALAHEAMYDSPVAAAAEDKSAFFAGPDPCDEAGVGIWAAPL